MNYLKITLATVAIVGIAGITYTATSYKELKKVNTIEGVNVYMANPVNVDYSKNLVVRMPENFQTTDVNLKAIVNQ